MRYGISVPRRFAPPIATDVELSTIHGAYNYAGWLNKGPRGDFMKEQYTLKNLVDTGFYPMRHGYGLWETRQYLRWIEDKLNMDDRAFALTQKIIRVPCSATA